ncbi:MAG: hypothetical protein AB7K67_00905 [Hyphomicrobiaceae bacterium]
MKFINPPTDLDPRLGEPMARPDQAPRASDVPPAPADFGVRSRPQLRPMPGRVPPPKGK